MRDVAGIDSVGIGASYDGINAVPKGLEDVSKYTALFSELYGSGDWSLLELKKLAGLNFLRVWREVQAVGRALGGEANEERIPAEENQVDKPLVPCGFAWFIPVHLLLAFYSYFPP